MGPNCLAQLLSKAEPLGRRFPPLRLAPSWGPALCRAGRPAGRPLRIARGARRWHPVFLPPRHPFSWSLLSFQGPAEMPLQVYCHRCDNRPVSIRFLPSASMPPNPFPRIMVNCAGGCLVTKPGVVAGRDLAFCLFIPSI